MTTGEFFIILYPLMQHFIFAKRKKEKEINISGGTGYATDFMKTYFLVKVEFYGIGISPVTISIKRDSFFSARLAQLQINNIYNRITLPSLAKKVTKKLVNQEGEFAGEATIYKVTEEKLVDNGGIFH